MIVHPALSVSDDQESSADITDFHRFILVEVDFHPVVVRSGGLLRKVLSLLLELVADLHETSGFFDLTLRAEFLDLFEQFVDFIIEDLNPFPVRRLYFFFGLLFPQLRRHLEPVARSLNFPIDVFEQIATHLDKSVLVALFVFFGSFFFELEPKSVVVDFRAHPQIGFGVGEQLVGTELHKKVSADVLLCPLHCFESLVGIGISVTAHQLVQKLLCFRERHFVRSDLKLSWSQSVLD